MNELEAGKRSEKRGDVHSQMSERRAMGFSREE